MLTMTRLFIKAATKNRFIMQVISASFIAVMNPLIQSYTQRVELIQRAFNGFNLDRILGALKWAEREFMLVQNRNITMLKV